MVPPVTARTRLGAFALALLAALGAGAAVGAAAGPIDIDDDARTPTTHEVHP